MKINKTIIVCALFTSLHTKANDDISYSWFEINYENQKVSTYGFGEALTLDGSYELSDDFYLRTDYSRLIPNDSTIYENSYSVRLGFHKAMSESTDFYAELGYRNNEPRFFKSNGAFEPVIGTRTILSPKFELITSLAYKKHSGVENINTPSISENGANTGITGLYKINDSSGLHFGINFENTRSTALLGYRFSW